MKRQSVCNPKAHTAKYGAVANPIAELASPARSEVA